MPLWEGFDEPFHFGYVQHLSTMGSLPEFGKTTLAAEVRDSILLAPASHVVKSNISGVMTFDEFYRLRTEQQKTQLQRLRQINSNLRTLDTGFLNYEAHQTPLPYAILAPFESALSELPIGKRVFLLRCIAGVMSVGLMAIFAVWLARESGLEGTWVSVLLLCAFCSQMYYATVVHICNDWLSVPLVTAWLAAVCNHTRRNHVRSAAILGGITSLGLLSKAYFLALTPMSLIVLVYPVVRNRKSFLTAIAGLALVTLSIPWYWRNVALYGNVTGTAEATNGAGFFEVIRAADSVPWLSSIAYMARASVWTGNNSFSNFSVPTINMYLLLIGLLFALYLRNAVKQRGKDVLILLGIFIFVVSIGYATIASYLYTHGRSAGASPWYMQPLLVPVLTLCLLGARASGTAGRLSAGALAFLSVYILAATYLAKLIPLYNGFAGGKSTIPALASWYSRVLREGTVSLSLIRLTFVGPMAIAICILGAVLLVIVCIGLQRSKIA